MTEPISLASGLLALATFALQSSFSLYDTIHSFKVHQNRVRELLEELESLKGVLEPLADTVKNATDVDLSALDLPLLRCGNACNEFQQELINRSSRSSGERASFRDWAKLRYMGGDIDGFRRQLAAYKLTINIALTDTNLRRSSLNAEIIESYKDMIESAKADFDAHLDDIDEKLGKLVGERVPESDSDASELRQIREERLSTERCLQICAQLSSHINEIEPTLERNSSSSGTNEPGALPERVTNDGLQECKSSLHATIAKLEKHMQELMDRLIMKSRGAMSSNDEIADLARLREEWETARQCMDICNKAESNLKESVSKIENYGTGDSLQFMVSTNGKVLHGTNRGLGWRNRQVGGYVSDTSVQQISRDMTSFNIRTTGNEYSPPRDNSPNSPDDVADTESEFGGRHGRGFRLASKAASEVQMSTTGFSRN